tara:strand:+ start:2529 stop:2897 length:369 start_codon:yes stop_codon:yes gene_type:complete
LNELIVIEPTDALPVVPDNWDYDISVEKTKTFFYKWKNLTDDIKEELWIAREKLSIVGRNWNESSNKKTWSDYCEELGTSRQVVNRWLEKAYSSKKITTPNQPEFDEDIETDNECPNCGYEW